MTQGSTQGTLIEQTLERPLRPGEVSLDELERAFRETATEVAAAPPVDELKYQTRVEPTEAAESDELLTLKLRYKQPDGDVSKLLEFPLKDIDQAFSKADRDYQFAAAVASFGMLLRNSKYKGDATYASVLEIAAPAAAEDASGYRPEFLELVRKAGRLAGEGL